MTAEGHKVASLHGAKDASERDAIIDAFRQGKDKVRVLTPFTIHLLTRSNPRITRTLGLDHDKRDSSRNRHSSSEHGSQL